MNSSGFFVAIDGPSGIGKTTLTTLLAREFAAHGFRVLATKEPTNTPLGNLARFGTTAYKEHALTCLVAADRYQHLTEEIRPAFANQHIVLCDRYFASTLVLQHLDGVPLPFLWHLHEHIDRPNLNIILTGNSTHTRTKIDKRGHYSRFHQGGLSHTIQETHLYTFTAIMLAATGWPVLIHHVQTNAQDLVKDLYTTITQKSPPSPPRPPHSQPQQQNPHQTLPPNNNNPPAPPYLRYHHPIHPTRKLPPSPFRSVPPQTLDRPAHRPKTGTTQSSIAQKQQPFPCHHHQTVKPPRSPRTGSHRVWKSAKKFSQHRKDLPFPTPDTYVQNMLEYAS